MKKILLTLITALIGTIAQAQALPCPSPTPGQPHVCLTWTASTTTGVTYNVYRATTAGAENFAVPLNAAPIPTTQLWYYDTTVAIGTTYFYKLVAVGTGGVLSLPTPEVQAQIPVPPSSPTTPAAAID